MSLPKIIFDTSAIRAMSKDAAFAEPYIRALSSGFEVLLTAMSVDELAAAPVPRTRETQFACCQQLLNSGKCVWPPHEIITRLVLAHANDARRFNWQLFNHESSIKGACHDHPAENDTVRNRDERNGCHLSSPRCA
jgi:uncharacterized protein with PIN domain